MKKLFTLIPIAAVLISFLCCEKDSNDFRNIYLGSWNYTVIISKHNFDSIGQHEEDTISFLGKISRGNAKNDLNIQYTKDSSIVLNIDEFGNLSAFPTSYCNGEFEGDNKIHLFLRWGGLGGFASYRIDGAR